jgi:hypothetical protein
MIPTKQLLPWRGVKALTECLNAGSPEPSFSEHAVRHYVRNAARNGLAPYVRRIGRKILISEPGFQAWLESRDTYGTGEFAA